MRTSRSAANPGRQFFKCPHPSEADACLKVAWVDEWTGGPLPATQPVRCASQHSGRIRCSAAAIEHALVARQRMDAVRTWGPLDKDDQSTASRRAYTGLHALNSVHRNCDAYIAASSRAWLTGVRVAASSRAGEAGAAAAASAAAQRAGAARRLAGAAAAPAAAARLHTRLPQVSRHGCSP